MATEYRPTADVPAPPWSSAEDPATRITGVRTILTAPEGVTLVVVRVDTNVDGLYGLGCATFTQRALAVKTAIDEYCGPLVTGRDPADITDVLESLRLDSYWRGGPVLNSALGGIDMALWDIKGKQAGMPVWQLLGGRTRQVVPAYTHAYGADPGELVDDVRRALEQGYRHVRCQVDVPGSVAYGVAKSTPDATWDAESYLRVVPPALERVRSEVGDEVELLHDVHERLTPQQAVWLARALEPYRLFFLEDPVAPEDLDWLAHLRAHTSIPIAIGELFTDVGQYVPLVAERRIDFVRCHLSAIGGLTPGWRLAAGGAVRAGRCPHGLARAARRLTDRARGERRLGPVVAQLRDPRAPRVRRARPRGVCGDADRDGRGHRGPDGHRSRRGPRRGCRRAVSRRCRRSATGTTCAYGGRTARCSARSQRS